MTPAEIADLYVATVNGPENGWGQCIVNSPGHPCHGAQSHTLLMYLHKHRGEYKTSDLLDVAFEAADG